MVRTFVRSICKLGAYSTDLGYLRDYLKGGIDSYDFPHLVEQYLDQTTGVPGEFEDGIDYIEHMTPADLENFKKWISNQPLHDDMSDPNSPSYLYMSYDKLLKNNTWLVHFSDEVSKIESEGFAQGHEDERSLGLTTYFKDRKNKGPGWNFAFVAASKDAANAAANKKYGKHAVLFQSAGVQVRHHGDEENQVIFKGEGVHEVVPLYKDENGEWTIESSRDNRQIIKGDFTQIINWVFQNYAQYRRVIVRSVSVPLVRAFVRSFCKFT